MYLFISWYIGDINYIIFLRYDEDFNSFCISREFNYVYEVFIFGDGDKSFFVFR